MLLQADDADHSVVELRGNQNFSGGIAVRSFGVSAGDNVRGIIRILDNDLTRNTQFAANQVTLNDATLAFSGTTLGEFIGNITGAGAQDDQAVLIDLANPAQVLTLSGANTYAGVTSIQQGVLEIANNSAVGVNDGLQQNEVRLSGGTLRLGRDDNAADTVELQKRINLVTASGGIDVAANDQARLSGPVVGNALRKSGQGTLILTGINNTYNGGTRIESGTVRAGATNALGTGDITFVSGVLGLGLADVDNADDGDGNASEAVALSNNIFLDGDIQVNVDANDSGTLTGAIVESVGIAQPAGVTKTGSGTLTLSGNNQYRGGTSLAGGTLIAGSSQVFGSGAISFAGQDTNIGLLDGVNVANDVTGLAAAGRYGLIVQGTDVGTLSGTIFRFRPLVEKWRRKPGIIGKEHFRRDIHHCRGDGACGQ